MHHTINMNWRWCCHTSVIGGRYKNDSSRESCLKCVEDERTEWEHLRWDWDTTLALLRPRLSVSVAFAPTALPELCLLVRTRPAHRTGRNGIRETRTEKKQSSMGKCWKKRKRDFMNVKRRTLETGQDWRHKDLKYKVVQVQRVWTC